MHVNDVDANLKYLILTLLLLVPILAWHNVAITEADAKDFGLCNGTISCQGVEAGDACLGIEKRNIACVTPENASTRMMAEAECGLDAQGICNANPELSGLEWADNPNAAYQGQTCSQWAEQNQNVDLLRCEDTFDDITQWSGEN